MLTLRELLPPRYYKSAELARLWETADAIFAPLWQAVFDVERQLDVSTATWGLALYERDYGLMANVSQSDSERRTRIKTQMSGVATSTIEHLRGIAEAYSGGEAAVDDQSELFQLLVKFIGVVGVPSNMEDLHAAMTDARPAHMLLEYIIRCRIWKEVREKTWGVLTERTWQAVKEITF